MKEKLIKIHNELSTINVRGEDTITMARCLLTLRDLINEREDIQNGGD